LLQQASLISKLIDWLNALKPHLSEEGMQFLQSKLAKVANYSLDKSWNDFEKNFTTKYPGLNVEIRTVYPDLSLANYRLLCFLIMRLTNREIAAITLQSLNSIRAAKYRLRNKLNASSDDDLKQLVDHLRESHSVEEE
jgi:DNA-binding CsgD family transcriptional regulator